METNKTTLVEHKETYKAKHGDIPEKNGNVKSSDYDNNKENSKNHIDSLSQRCEESSEKAKESEKIQGRWTKDEHNKFLEALKIHGNLWIKVAEYVETRAPSQVRSHAQKHFNKLTTKAIKKAKIEGNKIFVSVKHYINRSLAADNLYEINDDPSMPVCSPPKKIKSIQESQDLKEFENCISSDKIFVPIPRYPLSFQKLNPLRSLVDHSMPNILFYQAPPININIINKL